MEKGKLLKYFDILKKERLIFYGELVKRRLLKMVNFHPSLDIDEA